MLTGEELQALESLLSRVRHVAGIQTPDAEAVKVGDLVQLRPGADDHWGTSFLLVGQVRETGEIRGTILRPHRGSWRDAWYRYTPPEVAKIGSAPYPEPPMAIRSAGYWPVCPSCHNVQKRKPKKRAKKRAK